MGREFRRFGEGKGSHEFPKGPMTRIDDIRARSGRRVLTEELWAQQAQEDVAFLLDLVDRAVPHMECMKDDGDLEPEDLMLISEWLRDAQGDTP